MLFNCGNRTLDLSRPNVMGILNVTPDSFSDGGQYCSVESALQQAEQMVQDGADLIDVGGESTRPGAKTVSSEEELARVIPVVEAIASRLDVALSVDTSTPVVMSAAAMAGAHLINDVRALQNEGALGAAVKSGLSVCLMHMQGQPDTMQAAPSYQQVESDIYDFLAQRIQACQQVGIEKSKIIADPGFGFGKTLDHNLTLLAKLECLNALGVPLLAGLSRKSMIGTLLGDRPVEDRLFGSVSAAVIAAMKGARIIRVHDVKETADALKIVAGIKEQDR